MTILEGNAARIFEDARRMGDAALARLAAGDLRDSAEKAWDATLRATEALILTCTGQRPATSIVAGRSLRALVEEDHSFEGLAFRYHYRQEALHSECSEHAYCHPAVTARLVRETRRYIRDAERLAQRLLAA